MTASNFSNSSSPVPPSLLTVNVAIRAMLFHIFGLPLVIYNVSPVFCVKLSNDLPCSNHQKSSSPIASLDEIGDGGSRIPFRDRMDEDRELRVVTGTSGVATSGAEQRSNCKGNF